MSKSAHTHTHTHTHTLRSASSMSVNCENVEKRGEEQCTSHLKKTPVYSAPRALPLHDSLQRPKRHVAARPSPPVSLSCALWHNAPRLHFMHETGVSCETVSKPQTVHRSAMGSSAPASSLSTTPTSGGVACSSSPFRRETPPTHRRRLSTHTLRRALSMT